MIPVDESCQVPQKWEHQRVQKYNPTHFSSSKSSNTTWLQKCMAPASWSFTKILHDSSHLHVVKNTSVLVNDPETSFPFSASCCKHAQCNTTTIILQAPPSFYRQDTPKNKYTIKIFTVPYSGSELENMSYERNTKQNQLINQLQWNSCSKLVMTWQWQNHFVFWSYKSSDRMNTVMQWT